MNNFYLIYFMMIVLSLDSHFFQGMRSQKCSNLCLNRSIETKKHDFIVLSDSTIDKNSINSYTESINLFDFHNCTIKLIFLDEHSRFHVHTCVLNHNGKNIGDTLTGDTRSRYNWEISLWIRIIPIKCCVDRIFG